MPWLEFIISAAVIVLAGVRLTVNADRLSQKLGLGQMWVGIVLLGLVTSLPEAVTSISAIVSFNADDLALGNLLGSNNFNPLLIVFMDLFHRKGSVTDAVRPNDSHKYSALFAITLTFIVVLEVALSASPHAGPLTVGGVLIACLYIGGIKKLGDLGVKEIPVSISMSPDQGDEPTTSNIVLQLLLTAALVTVAGLWLARSADTIAVRTGLGGTFVGSIFLACVTSLPEMVVTLSAMRLGALDLAIGNIFGSNMTNVFIIFLCSLVAQGEPIFARVSRAHIFTGLLSILLVTIALSGIYVKNKKKMFGLGWDSALILAAFVAGTFLLHRLG